MRIILILLVINSPWFCSLLPPAVEKQKVLIFLQALLLFRSPEFLVRSMLMPRVDRCVHNCPFALQKRLSSDHVALTVLINEISALSQCLFTLKADTPTHLLQRSDRPAASETSNNAAPAFVQLGIVGADVAPYIPQSEERLTAELHGGQKVSGLAAEG